MLATTRFLRRLPPAALYCLPRSHTPRFTHTTPKNIESGALWLHPAGGTIERLNVAAKYAQLNILVCLTINSSLPLEPAHFEEALTHLYRKISPLRACFRWREGTLWVCEALETRLDFSVLEDSDVSTAINKLLHQPFDNSTEAPLWRTRLLPAAPGTPCPIPEMKEKFPHQYDFVFHFHHGLCDGLTAMVILNTFLKLLEDVVSGAPISKEQLGKFVSGEQTMDIEREVLRNLESRPEDFKRMIHETMNTKFTPLLEQAFGISEKESFPTGYIVTDLEPRLLQSFQDQCQSHGVTLNSGMTSVINTALVELVADAGLVRDVYSVTSRHPVNQRRYWKGDPITDLGNHMGAMSHTMQTPLHNRNTFWEYAKQFDSEFRRKLKDGFIFQERIVMSKIMPKDYSYESFYSSPPTTIYDYMFSNVLMPGIIDYGIGNKVQLTATRNVSNISNCEYSNMHAVTLFRDRVLYNIMYASGRVSRSTMQAFLSKVVTVLNSLS
ncbi:uncharacterized protein LOC125034172 [Penaeus chinensis]|uniref:uncharacterized protein LOC125034172 n=1 Tax=Penaeus chinensis TaxID=139456 RepID=UPI001FB827FC|nr:uncharacterized protein LOC125034172 [Penaeus chinensis]